MAKKYKFNPTNTSSSTDKIRPTEVRDTEKVSFNFKRLTEKDDKFKYTCKDSRYFCVLLERLRQISGMNKLEMIIKNKDPLRCHKVDFNHSSVSENSFGLLGDDVIEDAWQFQLTSNEHGRVHGYFVDNVFYVVWLDPLHELYPED